MGTLGRVDICGSCEKKSNCFWPGQYSVKNLHGRQVIFGTQVHMTRSTQFIDQLKQLTAATRVLVLFDEGNFIVSPFRRKIGRKQLEYFYDALTDDLRQYPNRQQVSLLKHYVEVLLTAKTVDLRKPDWRICPLAPKTALSIQASGWALHGKDFWFLGEEIVQFGASPIESRLLSTNGDIHFATPPAIEEDFVFFSGSTPPALAEFRMGVRFSDPFATLSFEHPETVWYCLSSRLGMAIFFQKNAPQIFDFFGELLVRRLREGKRILLVTKKNFVDMCAAGMQRRLEEKGLGHYQVLPADQADITNFFHVPILHFGVIGVNDYQDFDGIYCLCGFYTNPKILNAILQDVPADDLHLDIEIKTSGKPLRRIAGVKHAKDQVYDLHSLAQKVLDEQEIGIVLQAIGRVRPFSRPREVFLFQCGQLPGVKYTAEFNTLGEARRYFEIPTSRTQQKDEIGFAIQKCKQEGLTQSKAATVVGRSIRTVKRYW